MTSLPRTVEPELMNDDEQALAYADADFAAPHEAFVDRFVDFVGGVGVAGVCLDLGCGPADVVMRLARRCPRLIIDGVDGAEAMLAIGRRRVREAGLSNRVRLYRAWLPQELAAEVRETLELANQPPGNVHMDLFNNGCGVQEAGKKEPCMLSCYERHRAGQLVERGDSAYIPEVEQFLPPIERWIRNLAQAL